MPKTLPGTTASPLTPPPVTPEPGWIPVRPANLESGRGFVSGDPAGDRIRVAYFRREGEPGLLGRAWFGPRAEGPPGHAHGGSLGAVLDEAMGSAAWLAGFPVVAARLEIDYRRMVPLGTDTHLQAWIESVEGRKVDARGRLTSADGQPFTEARGLFLVLDPERFAPLLGEVASSLGIAPEELLERLRERRGASPPVW
jgi:acyl-coenzyme A thioesterase PaaI-like protein